MTTCERIDERPASRTGAAGDTSPCYLAEDLLSGANTAHIKLGTQTYTLRLTRAGKLILTK